MIKKYKNFLTDQEKNIISEFIERYSQWQYSGYSTLEFKDFKFWNQDLENNQFFSKFLFEKICKHVGEDLSLERVYMNGHNSDSHGWLHLDDVNENGRTFLIYCNEFWDVNHGGSTVFMTKDGPNYIYPEPFSAVYFDATLYHAAQPISKNFMGLRVTLAYKLKKI